MSIEELKQEVRDLPEKERADFVADLLSTFSSSSYDVSDAEVARRVAETESGEVEDISYDELKAAIEKRSRK